MNDWKEIGTDWGTFRSRVAQRCLKLSGAELDAIAGNRDTLVRMLQSRYGLAKEQADSSVTSFVENGAGDLMNSRALLPTSDENQGWREHPR